MHGIENLYTEWVAIGVKIDDDAISDFGGAGDTPLDDVGALDVDIADGVRSSGRKSNAPSFLRRQSILTHSTYSLRAMVHLVHNNRGRCYRTRRGYRYLR